MSDMQLILHIGAGKTGTSSIQNTLRKNLKNLKKKGYWYLGLLLENIDNKQYSWQNSFKNKEFHALSQKDTTEQTFDVFKEIIVQAKKEKIHTLIWSNESFFERNENLHQLLNLLENHGIRLKIIVYVRDYVSWARSAYIQWGIRHKTYKGNIQPFRTWIVGKLPKFYTSLNPILNKFPNQVFIKNMNEEKDVVESFFNFCNLDTTQLNTKRRNESPRNEELLLRAIFNNNYKEKVLPNRFNQIVDHKLKFDQTPVEYLQSLLPTQEELNQLRKESKEDRILLNQLLKQQNQECIKAVDLPLKSFSINSDIILRVLCEITLSQASKIQNIEKILMEEM